MKQATPPTGVSINLVNWVRAMFRGPSQITPYTIATLPSAADWNGTTLPVSDGTGGKPTVTAIGGAWKYPDGSSA